MIGTVASAKEKIHAQRLNPEPIMYAARRIIPDAIIIARLQTSARVDALRLCPPYICITVVEWISAYTGRSD